jgi:hypothetical protein
MDTSRIQKNLDIRSSFVYLVRPSNFFPSTRYQPYHLSSEFPYRKHGTADVGEGEILRPLFNHRRVVTGRSDFECDDL